MTVEFPKNAGLALRRAPPEQQKKILAILADWPCRAGLGKELYSQAMREAVKRLLGAWGGIWLNPDGKARDLKLQCSQGHIWRCPWVTYLQRGRWCPECSTLENQKKALEEVKGLALERGGEYVSGEYKSLLSKLTFRCNLGHVWEANTTQIRSSRYWCPTCRAKQNKHELLYLHKLAAKRGGLCLAKQHISVHTKVKWQCALGHTWMTTPATIYSGSWCPRCAFDPKRLTIEEMQEIAKSKGGKCLSKQYKSVETKLRWECKLGHHWKATPNNIKAGKWRPQCAHLAKCKHEKSKRKYLPDRRKGLDAVQ
jgi:hypothetical protein